MTPRSGRQLMRFLTVSVVVISSLWLVSSAFAALPTDTTMADFNLGDVGLCFIGPSTWDGGIDGEVILPPELAADFSGTSFPVNWYIGSYNGTDFPIVSDDVITVERSYAGVLVAYDQTRTLEFEAVFSGPNQWIGFASDTNLNNIPWALFGTFDSGTDLFAQTSFDASTLVIPGGLGIPHRFRIDWEAGVINYYIDNALVATHDVNIAVSMRPIVADNADGNLLSVDWLRMGPYAPTSCTYTSRLFDSGIVDPDWTTLATSVYVPANTTLSFETRSGDTTDTTDTSWSAWQAVSGGVIASPNRRYLQYRALLATSDVLASPRVYSVQPQGTGPTAVAVIGIAGKSLAPGAEAGSISLMVNLGALGLILLGYRARKARKSDH
jgi:hypothetical protein